MVFYMALDSLDTLSKEMQEYYKPDLPVAIVYYAGYPDREKVLRGTLENIAEKAARQEENWMGLVIVDRAIRSLED